ncbi:MAG: pantetheine-phosphate adenylyltransferase [Chlamydiales bacterium]
MRRIGIFPGTFDPPTLGHLAIIQKSGAICEHLVIAIGLKPGKTSLFSVDERREMLQKIAPEAEIHPFHGLIVDFAKEKKGSFLIRGLRSLADCETELQMAEANRRLSGIETVFFGADEPHISSSLIREIAHFKGSLNGFVPKEIEPLIRKKFP